MRPGTGRGSLPPHVSASNTSRAICANRKLFDISLGHVCSERDDPLISKKTDGATVTFTKLPDNKFKVMGGTWDREAHFLADQVLEVPDSGWAASLPPAPEGSGPREMPPSVKEAHRTIPSRSLSGDAVTAACNSVSGKRVGIMQLDNGPKNGRDRSNRCLTKSAEALEAKYRHFSRQALDVPIGRSQMDPPGATREWKRAPAADRQRRHPSRQVTLLRLIRPPNIVPHFG